MRTRTASLLAIMIVCLSGCARIPAVNEGGRAAQASESISITRVTPTPALRAQADKPAPPMSSPYPARLLETRRARCAASASGMLASHGLNSESATYLGSGQDDVVNAVEIAADCSVLAAGRMGAIAGFSSPTELVPGVASTSGLLVELTNEGRSVRRQRRFGSVLNDLATNAVEDVLVGGDAGLVRLSANLQTVLWSKTGLGAANRVALADDGTAAALFDKTLRVFDALGNPLATRNFGDAQVNDVAIDASGVYVTGFAQRDGGPCSQLQVAWVRAFDHTGTPRWQAWDWTHAQAAGTGSSCADSRGLRIATGRDGGLYFAGESAGGNSIYRYQSTALSEAAPNVSTDAHNTGYNTAAPHISYIARLDTANGRVLKGQLLLARLSSGKGNTIRPRAISADEQGRVYVAGSSACCIADRSALTFNGRRVADYAGGDPWVLVLSPDLRTRHLWFTAANGGNGEALGVAVSRGLAVLGSRASSAPMLLDRAVQTDRPTGASNGGHLMGWSVSSPSPSVSPP